MLDSDGYGFSTDSIIHFCSFTWDNNLTSLSPAFLSIKMDVIFWKLNERTLQALKCEIISLPSLYKEFSFSIGNQLYDLQNRL